MGVWGGYNETLGTKRVFKWFLGRGIIATTRLTHLYSESKSPPPPLFTSFANSREYSFIPPLPNPPFKTLQIFCTQPSLSTCGTTGTAPWIFQPSPPPYSRSTQFPSLWIFLPLHTHSIQPSLQMVMPRIWGDRGLEFIVGGRGNSTPHPPLLYIWNIQNLFFIYVHLPPS